MDRHFNKVVVLLVVGFLPCVVVTDPTPGYPDDCPDGQFYAYWEDPAMCKMCGVCKDEAICNKATQLCPDGCQKWFGPPSTCWGYIDETTNLGHITDGPEVKNMRTDRVEICFYQDMALAESDLASYYAYRIQYALAHQNSFNDDVDHIPVQSELLIHKDVLGLKYNTEYKFRIKLYRVWAVTGEFEAISYSGVTYGRTRCEVPLQPEILRAVPLADLSSVYVTWRPVPAHRCNGFSHVRLSYRLTNETDNWQRMNVQLSQTALTVYRLVPGLSYYFILQTGNDAGYIRDSLLVQVNLIEEALDENSLPVRGTDSGEDDDDTLVYVAIAIAAAVGLIAIIGLIISLYLCTMLRRNQKKSAPVMANNNTTADYSNAHSGSPPNPPPPRDQRYEGLRGRAQSHTYDGLNNDQCPPDNPTYDVL